MIEHDAATRPRKFWALLGGVLLVTFATLRLVLPELFAAKFEEDFERDKERFRVEREKSEALRREIELVDERAEATQREINARTAVPSKGFRGTLVEVEGIAGLAPKDPCFLMIEPGEHAFSDCQLDLRCGAQRRLVFEGPAKCIALDRRMLSAERPDEPKISVSFSRKQIHLAGSDRSLLVALD